MKILYSNNKRRNSINHEQLKEKISRIINILLSDDNRDKI